MRDKDHTKKSTKIGPLASKTCCSNELSVTESINSLIVSFLKKILSMYNILYILIRKLIINKKVLCM